MRILYLCTDPGIPIYGRKGCSTHVRETCHVLAAQGHDVRVVSANTEGDVTDPPINVLAVESFTSRRLGFDLRRILVDRRVWRRILRLERSWKPDVIYERYSLYSRAGEKAERRFGIPRIMEVNAFLTKEQTGRIRWPWWARRVEHSIIGRAPRVIVVSEPLRREVHALGVPLEHIVNMPMAVDLDRFHPDTPHGGIRREWGFDDGRFIIGYVGTLAGWHGLDLLFGMVSRLRAADAPPFAFVVVGGEDRKLERYREKTAQLGLDDCMRFVGSTPHERIPSCLGAMDAGIVPDTTYWSSPSKLFEYMASGLAILAPRYPAIEGAVDHGREALLYAANDVDAMTACALEMLRDPERARQLGRAARLRAERERSWTLNAHRIVEMFEAMR